MDDPSRMSKRDRITDPQQNVQILRHRVRGEAFFPFDAHDLLHCVENCIVRLLADIVDRHDVGMIQPARDDGFRNKRCLAALQACRARLQHLDCHRTIHRLLTSRVNRAHPAFTQQLFNLIVGIDIDSRIRRAVARLLLRNVPSLQRNRWLNGRTSASGGRRRSLDRVTRLHIIFQRRSPPIDDRQRSIGTRHDRRIKIAIVRFRTHTRRPVERLTDRVNRRTRIRSQQRVTNCRLRLRNTGRIGIPRNKGVGFVIERFIG